MYQVPPSKKSLKQNQFEFQLPGETRVRSVPLLKFIRPSFIRDFGDLDETKFMIKFLDTELPDVLDTLEDAEQLTNLLNAWSAESGVSLGESEPSPDSSPSTGEQSATSSSPSAFDSTGSVPEGAAG